MSRAGAEIPTQPDGGPARNTALETVARRERMVAAAVELATAGGYEAVQMRDVAARAEVALGTLYRHYPSKDHLLLAALTEQAESAAAARRVRRRDAHRRRPAPGESRARAPAAADRRAGDRAHRTRARHRRGQARRRGGAPRHHH